MSSLEFFPVVHLLTGPPGLDRNGGIWKTIKKELIRITPQPNLMVQAMHFTTYNLSIKAWDGWFYSYNCKPFIQKELNRIFGDNYNLFIDSGGFQLLYKDFIDLSKWNMNISPEDIYNLQIKFNPTHIASLDYPIGNGISNDILKKRMKDSIKNGIEMLRISDNSIERYVVVHGRNENEIKTYLQMLYKELKKNKLLNENYFIALGSQVPLTNNPKQIQENIVSLMKISKENEIGNGKIHVFGIGDSIAGEIYRKCDTEVDFSYDNSTYVQQALRSRLYDPSLDNYSNYDPYMDYQCNCYACRKLKDYHNDGNLEKILHSPSYKRVLLEDGNYLIKSEFYGLLALHNLFWTKRRQNIKPKMRITLTRNNIYSTNEEYNFPLRGFKNKGDLLLLLQCSKTKPYFESTSHKRMKNILEKYGYFEGKDYDRITLSGLLGPVHWNDELNPIVMSYNFKLTNITSDKHYSILKYKTTMILNVINKKYDRIYAFLPNKNYQKSYQKILESFNIRVFTNYHDINSFFLSNSNPTQ